MGKQLANSDLDQIVLQRIREKTETRISSDFDFIERMTFASNAWDAIEQREARKFQRVEDLEAKVQALKDANAIVASRDYELLRKIHFQESELEKARKDVLPAEEVLDSIVEVMAELEAMALQDIGSIPHNFFDT